MVPVFHPTGNRHDPDAEVFITDFGRELDQPVIAPRHHPTYHGNWNTFEADMEPVVEIFQGCRYTTEYAGAPDPRQTRDDGPYGGKGVGEISTMPVPPAIVNAVYNATGIRLKRVPVDQDWLAMRIKEKGAE